MESNLAAPQDPIPASLGTIRISIPARISANIDNLQKSIKNIAERLGCGQCFSGAHCLLELERDFYINEKLVVNSIQLEKKPIQQLTGNTLQINMEGKAAYNMDNILNATKKIAELTGHPNCATGCNIYFNNFLEQMQLFNIAEGGEISPIGIH